MLLGWRRHSWLKIVTGWSNTSATMSSRNCEKYSWSTLSVARYLRSHSHRRADAGCCVLNPAPAQEWPRNSEGPKSRYRNITVITSPPMIRTGKEKHVLTLHVIKQYVWSPWCCSLRTRTLFYIPLHVYVIFNTAWKTWIWLPSGMQRRVVW